MSWVYDTIYLHMQEAKGRLAVDGCGLLSTLAGTDTLSFPRMSCRDAYFLASTPQTLRLARLEREREGARGEMRSTAYGGPGRPCRVCMQSSVRGGGGMVHVGAPCTSHSSVVFWKRTPAIAPGESSVQQRSASELGPGRP